VENEDEGKKKSRLPGMKSAGPLDGYEAYSNQVISIPDVVTAMLKHKQGNRASRRETQISQASLPV